MTDTTGGDPRPSGGDQPSGSEQRPSAQPSPGSAQQPYGQPQQPFGAPPPSPSPYGQPPVGPPSTAQPSTAQPSTAQPEPAPPSYTQEYEQPYPQQGYGQPGYGQPGYGQPGYGDQYGGYVPISDKRPATVTAAGVITLMTAGLMFVLLAVTLVTVLAAGPDSQYVQEIVDEMARQNEAYEDFSAQTIVNIAAVGIGIALAWSLVAMLLAVFAMRRSNAARIGLVVSAALVCVPTGLIGLTGAFPMLVLGAACVAVIVCLFAGGANAWYARRHGARPRSGGIAPPIA